MIKELSNKFIYNDFVSKTFLTDEEIKILDMYILKCSICHIALERNMSDRSVSRIIKDIKEKYYNYRKIEIVKIDVFMTKN